MKQTATNQTLTTLTTKIKDSTALTPVHLKPSLKVPFSSVQRSVPTSKADDQKKRNFSLCAIFKKRSIVNKYIKKLKSKLKSANLTSNVSFYESQINPTPQKSQIISEPITRFVKASKDSLWNAMFGSFIDDNHARQKPVFGNRLDQSANNTDHKSRGPSFKGKFGHIGLRKFKKYLQKQRLTQQIIKNFKRQNSKIILHSLGI